jgi:NADH:ubiquinone oxidoreductase subunit F (NADH-binding)
MQRYPDLLNNPDNDPVITQQQYEDWYREQEECEECEECREGSSYNE